MDELIVRLDTYGGSFRRGALTRSASASESRVDPERGR
jgi:hypothetical protein